MNLQDDKVYEFLDACWKAGIKNPASFLISKRPQVYDWLKGVFPRNSIPTDIDGEVEVNGYFLRLEFKDESALRNGYISRGQLSLLKRLTMTNVFTVFIIGTNLQGDPTCVEVFLPGGKRLPISNTNRELLVRRLKKWSDWAEDKPAGTPLPP